MKIFCDVCEKDEATVYCVADEASLCAACDQRVHHANKLAGKHQRFSLLHPSPKQAPLCDICQERRAFLFCQQDRAILCKDCDIPIHKANEHTQKHTRFLLTGVKLSATSTLYSESPSSGESASSNNASDAVSKTKPDPAVPTAQSTPPPARSTTLQSNFQLLNGGNLINGPISTSSISEYLMEMLPGWHVEDFLDSSSPSPSPSPSGFCQSGENDLLPLWDGDFQKNMSIFSSEVGFWVPQAPPSQARETENQFTDLGFGLANGYVDNQLKEFSCRKRIEDNSFTVPQVNPSSIAIERSRTFW